MSMLEGFDQKKLSNAGKRLLHEWKEIDNLCRNNQFISYIVRKKNPEGLPVGYEIIYKIKSIIGVAEAVNKQLIIGGKQETRKVRPPIYGREHRMRIHLPNRFPAADGNPELVFLTDIWHPNIRHAGRFKGRVCSNERDLGVATTLASRVIRVGKYLQYQMYHAEDTYPKPQDLGVAEWVREEAEPMGWINQHEGVFIDHSNLFARTRQEMVSDQAGTGSAGPEKPPKAIASVRKGLSGKKKKGSHGQKKPDVNENKKPGTGPAGTDPAVDLVI